MRPRVIVTCQVNRVPADALVAVLRAISSDQVADAADASQTRGVDVHKLAWAPPFVTSNRLGSSGLSRPRR